MDHSAWKKLVIDIVVLTRMGSGAWVGEFFSGIGSLGWSGMKDH